MRGHGNCDDTIPETLYGDAMTSLLHTREMSHYDEQISKYFTCALQSHTTNHAHTICGTVHRTSGEEDLVKYYKSKYK